MRTLDTTVANITIPATIGHMTRHNSIPVNRSLAKHMLALSLAMAALNATAAPDFDNLDIPKGKPFNLYGGCATITKYEPVTDQAPKFSNRRPDQGSIGSGTDIAILANTIPGVGSLVAAAVGLVTAGVANTAIAAHNEQKDIDAAKNKAWENVYLVTVKPDMGAEYSFTYENLNKRDMKAGAQIVILSDAHNPNGFTGYRFNVLNKSVPEVGSDDYFKVCHGDGKYGMRVLSDSTAGFEWKKLPVEYRAAADAYAAKAAEDRAKKEAERAEIDAMKKNESR